jgi:lipid-A-disaccharide synthase
VGLPNILCGDFVVPELLQEAATPHALADATVQWLAPGGSARMAALEARFTALHHTLQRDTAQLATDAIQKIIDKS